MKNYICDNNDCHAVWSVVMVGTSQYLLDPLAERFDYKCPACGCKHYTLDKAIVDNDVYY